MKHETQIMLNHTQPYIRKKPTQSELETSSTEPRPAELLFQNYLRLVNVGIAYLETENHKAKLLLLIIQLIPETFKTFKTTFTNK